MIKIAKVDLRFELYIFYQFNLINKVKRENIYKFRSHIMSNHVFSPTKQSRINDENFPSGLNKINNNNNNNNKLIIVLVCFILFFSTPIFLITSLYKHYLINLIIYIY